jgi:hypothetical protein
MVKQRLQIQERVELAIKVQHLNAQVAVLVVMHKKEY